MPDTLIHDLAGRPTFSSTITGRALVNSHVDRALLYIEDQLNDIAYNRPGLDRFIAQGAQSLLVSIESLVYDGVVQDLTTKDARRTALDILMRLEPGLNNDGWTYAVDRAKVTPLTENVMRAIVLGKKTIEA